VSYPRRTLPAILVKKWEGGDRNLYYLEVNPPPPPLLDPTQPLDG